MHATLTHGPVSIELEGTPEEVAEFARRLGGESAVAAALNPTAVIGPGLLPDKPAPGIHDIQRIADEIERQREEDARRGRRPWWCHCTPPLFTKSETLDTQ